MHRRTRTFHAPFSVERSGFFQRILVQGDDAVELRTFLVIGLDAREVHLDQLLRSQYTAIHPGLDVGDGRSRKVEGGRLCL
jgi:hypothetical protein